MPFMVVGTWHVFVMLVYRSWALTTVHGGCSTCLHHSFPSVTWRVLAANCQWVVDSGGAGLVGWVVIDVVGLLTVSIQNDDVVVVIVPHR